MGLSTAIGIATSFSRGGQSWESYWATRNASGLFLIVDSTTQITLYWFNNGTADYDDIRIERSTDGVTYSEINTAVNGTLLYVNSGLTADTTYYYRLRYRKGTNYSEYSNVATGTTYINITALSPFAWLRAEDISSADLAEINTWEDYAGSNDFANSTEEYPVEIFRNLPIKFITDKTTKRANLRIDFTSKNLSYFDLYIVLFPGYESHATQIKAIFGFRDSTTELLQCIETATTGVYTAYFRTSANSLKTITNEKHAGRFNILHITFDRTGNLVTFDVDETSQSLAYTFGAETLRSTLLSVMSYFLGTELNPENASPLKYEFAEVIVAFDNALVSSSSSIYSYLNNKYNLNYGGYSTDKTIAEIVAETPVVTDYIDRTAIYALVTAGTIHQFDIQTTDNPQTIYNTAPAGSLVRFKAGTHTHATGTNRSILYCDKPMYIELEAGAILKLADNSNTLDHTGEIVTNQGCSLNDLSIRGTYSGAIQQDLCVKIDHIGATDSFKWGIGFWEPTYTTQDVAITGDWQSLAGTGIEIKFNATTGHAVNDLWIICFDGEESYGIRVGTGFHTNYIKDVVIFGDGTIDMNYTNQIASSLHAKNLQAGILIHGRCFNTIIEGITIQNVHRAGMVYGDNDGTYGINGTVTGGNNYNCIGTKIINVTYLNDFADYPGGAGWLLGHPEHRGGNIGLIFNLNTGATYWNCVEPNFRLYNYEVRNNYLRSSYTPTIDIAQWRESINGIIVNNNATVQNPAAPTGWQTVKNIYSTANARS